MSEIRSETAEKILETEGSKSEIFTHDLIQGDIFKSDISKEKADDIYASVVYERVTAEIKVDKNSDNNTEITNEGPHSYAFRSYYEEIKEDYPEQSREEVYAELSEEYEYLEEWLHRSDDDWGIDLATYDEMRCVEDNGDITAEIDDDDDSYDPYY